jgi:hypothetical protein
MTAIEDLSTLLSSLPGYALLTDPMKNAALATALIPDGDDVWPGQPGYVDTHDVYWAALSMLGFLQAQPFVKQSSSEGTSVSVDAPSWSGLALYYRSMSKIAQATARGPLGLITIPGSPHVYHTDMSGRGDGNDDVNTDLG